MKTFLTICLTLLCLFLSLFRAEAQETTCLKVHFLYGSKPAKGYRDVEEKWFGGLLGGHVGLALEKDKVLNFVPHNKLHIVTHRRKKHSAYMLHSLKDFWEIMGGDADSCKTLTVLIPLSAKQEFAFDSIAERYLRRAPYDYALYGMRCGSAAYDVLSQLGILERYGYRKTYRKIFYPKILRRELLEKASLYGWKITRQEGTVRRKWESD